MLADEIQEIGEIIAQQVFGKPYRELRFAEEKGGLAKSELFHCSATAQTVRLEALKVAAYRFTGVRYGWPDILEICHEVIARPGAIEKQKEYLRKKGYLQ